MSSTHPIECANKCVKITPADDTDISSGTPMKGIWVGTAGTITGQDENGNDMASFPAQVGHNPVRFKQIDSTGTTASDIWGLY